jgi:hypothetical protein
MTKSWFEQGRKDGEKGKHEPPTMRDGARALADYNIGHYLGEGKPPNGVRLGAAPVAAMIAEANETA